MNEAEMIRDLVSRIRGGYGCGNTVSLREIGDLAVALADAVKRQLERDPSKWLRVSDRDVIHEWRCDDCGGTEYLDPSFYHELGTPVCEPCGSDKEYVCTRVNIGA